jgi:hypothetical protein
VGTDGPIGGVANMNLKRDIPEADEGFIADLDPDMAPIECSYCGELWCRGRCDPEPLVRVDPNGWEIP